MRRKIAGLMSVLALLIAMALPLVGGGATVYAHEGKHVSCAGGAQGAVAAGLFPPGPGNGVGGDAVSGLASSEPGAVAGIVDFLHDLFCS